MPNILFALIFIFLKVSNSYEANGDNIETQNMELKNIQPGISKTIFIKYLKETNFVFNISETDHLSINIHSINCNIEINNSNGTIQNKINFNIYSLKLNSIYNNIIVKPLIDIVDGRFKENYQLKECPIIINSYYIRNSTQQELRINNTEENAFYFPSIYNKSLNVSYEINNILKNSFVSLYFKFKEDSFLIDIFYINSNNQTNSLSKKITESSYIYLDSEFLNYNNSNIKGNLSISIQSINNINVYMFLKIIEENTVCLLEENALNFGFITSKTTYQYYFTEVLYGEEGELILHNKRQYGILHAKIINKTNIKNISDLYNTSNYPNGTSPEEKFEYNQHYLQLKFNNIDKSKCPNGCYLLITYEQIKSENAFPLVGYEFTLLSRTWNQTDYISSIIDIPFNEYIIGCFGTGASREHYYSIYIPDEAENIIIQLEGDYFQAFYEKGRKKINTLNEKIDTFEIKDDQNVFNFNATEFGFKGNFVSFAFKPTSYYTSIISSYYFRVLYTKKDEKKYLPIDSNFGNLCKPEKNSSSDYYYCYLILKNDYNESNIKFAISSTNQNEYVKINITGISKNENNENILFKNHSYYNYIYDKNYSDIDYFLFKFEFKNNEIKNIISSFCDKINETYPQIYSAQMFYLENFRKFHHFKLKNSFLGNYLFISGDSGKEVDYFSSPSFKGKHITFHVENGTENYSTVNKEYIYCIQLKPNLQIEEITELEQGKPLVQFTDMIYFPLYYYYQIHNKDYINININFKLSEHNKTTIKNYTINGYILNEESIIRKKNGEHIEMPNPIEGKYSDAYGLGFLQVNQKFEKKGANKIHYLLIVLEKKDNLKDEPNLPFFFVEIVLKEYDNNNGFFLPKNEYIVDTFDDENNNIRKINQYNISNPEGNEIQLVVEFSSQYSDTEIEFINVSSSEEDNKSGFRKFVINEENIDTIQINVTNRKQKDANYMIRYYFNESNDEYSFSLDVVNFNKTITFPNDDVANVKLTFDILEEKKGFLEGIDKITFFIYGTLYEPKEKSSETINNTCFLNERQVSYENKTSIDYFLDKNWTIEFDDIKRDKNFIYDLRLQIIARILNSNYKEEFLVFTTKVNLTEIKKESKKNIPWYAWGIPVIVVGIIIIILGFFIIKFLRLRKSNSNLQQDMVSLAFSNDIQKNVITRERELSKCESDFESTFI